jgi:thiamine-phosphate pyrophosphorylase
MLTTGLELPAALPELVAAGVQMVAIADQDSSDEELSRALSTLRRSVPPGRVLLGVCDRPGVLDAADFLHLTAFPGSGAAWPISAGVVASGAIRATESRPVEAPLPLGTLLGCTCESQAEFDAALVRTDLDYLCLGPVTALDLIRHACQRAPQSTAGAKVWFAAGGVNQANSGQLVRLGVRRLAVSQAITEANDPLAAASGLSEVLRAAWESDPKTDIISYQ